MDSGPENYISFNRKFHGKGWIAMRRKILLGTIVMCLIFAALLAPQAAAADKITKTGEIIYEDSYESDWLLGLGKGEKIEVSLDVVSPTGATVDVYILSSSQYSNYPSGSFSPTVAHEDVSTADFTFKSPDDQSYYLVIDNEDNSRAADAVPTGDVTVNYEYDDPLSIILSDLEDTAEDAFWTGMMICVIGIVLVIVIIVVIVVLVVKSGKSKQPPPQQQYQQPPYDQQGAYPPPGQPYQPPPGDQPPAQPPQQPPGDQAYYPPPNQGQWQQPPPNQGYYPPPDQQGYYPTPQQPQQPPKKDQE
jgi:flagellar basal body-associated protein FliL